MGSDVAVAGYVCLDIIPTFDEEKDLSGTWLQPGKLLAVGAAVTAPGGAVSNTGIALHRLGIPVKLIGKVGDDLFGQALLNHYRAYDESLAQSMIVSADDATSYTIVISPPGFDRFFLHATGANSSFRADDVNFAQLDGARIFHFGYPPLMRRMVADGGAELAQLFARAKAAGLTTALDMATPDPESAGARVDWAPLLARVLPHVDLFMPSLDDILVLLGQYVGYTQNSGEKNSSEFLNQAASRLLALGTASVVLKLGDQGLYLRTTADEKRISAMGAASPRDSQIWLDRELLAPCFQARVVGTTGAGDCAIAGFLAGLLKGLPLTEILLAASAAGAFNVEGPDATSSIPNWRTLQARIHSGWKQHQPRLSLAGWQQQGLIWRGPADSLS